MSTALHNSNSTTHYLDRPGGRIAFDVTGEGPLVVCAPGMGDIRHVYRFLTPALVAAGYQVATVDLRGHGDSDTTFKNYDVDATATDLLALIEHLGGSAVVVGNSMSAGAAVVAAAQSPDAVTGLVLIGPFVRNVPMGRAKELALRLGLLRPWGPSMWRYYYTKLYPSTPPDDLDEHIAAIAAAQSRPGAWRSFVAITRTTRDAAEANLDTVHVPTLVVMGTADPDFSDPAAEAQLVADRLGGDVLLVDGAGHYPQTEQPDVVGPAIVAFLARTVAGA